MGEYLPRELVEIIFRHCPWRALVLSQAWRKWAVAAILAVPVHGVPLIHRRCYHAKEYKRLSRVAMSLQGRSRILAWGEYVTFSDFGQLDTTYKVKFRSYMTIVYKFTHGVCERILISTPEGCIQTWEGSIDLIDTDGVIVRLVCDQSGVFHITPREYKYDKQVCIVCYDVICSGNHTRHDFGPGCDILHMIPVCDTNTKRRSYSFVPPSQIVFQPLSCSSHSISVQHYTKLCRMIRLLIAVEPNQEQAQLLKKFM